MRLSRLRELRGAYRAKRLGVLLSCVLLLGGTLSGCSTKEADTKETYAKMASISVKTKEDYERNVKQAKEAEEALIAYCISNEPSGVESYFSDFTSSHERLVDMSDVYMGYLGERQVAEETIAEIATLKAKKEPTELDLAVIKSSEESLEGFIDSEGVILPAWFDKFYVNRSDCFTQYSDSKTIQLINIAGTTVRSMTIVAVWENEKIVRLDRNIREAVI